jgi:exopolysaccharide biosynthesis polyprenyl glycosylphosphotransferase
MNLIGTKKYLMGFLQFCMDAMMLTASFMLAYFLKKTVFFPDPQLNSANYIKLYIIVLPFLLCTLYFSRLYTLRVIMLPWKKWLNTAIISVIYMYIMLIVLSFYLKIFSYSRLVFTLFLIIVFPSLIISKALFNTICVKPLLKNNKLNNNITFYTDRPGQALVGKLREWLGYNIDEVYLGEDEELAAPEIDRIRQGETGGVFIDLDNCRSTEIETILQKANREGISAYLSQRSIYENEFKISVENLGEQTVIAFYPKHIPGFGLILKRSIDLFLSSLAIIFLSPVMLLIACAIMTTSPGPVILRQTRVGFGGRLFTMYKFRTMHKDAELLTGPVWASKEDGRVTKVGRFLRRSYLDELPQLFNVLGGTMSLVGPRPERPEFVSDFKEEIGRYSHKHWVRPGITGWAQIHGWRGDTSVVERIRYDLFYIENWSLWIDLKILLFTPFMAY